MRIHAAINERTVRRTFREKKAGRNGLTVIDRDLPTSGLKVAKNGTGPSSSGLCAWSERPIPSSARRTR